jgi:ABC-type polysaccharide/polyol phosphate transport system ATPase subunit
VLVQLENVTVRGAGVTPLLNALNLRLRAGQRLAVFCQGRQARQSALALLRCIAGMQRPDAGRVVIEGHASWPFGQVPGLSNLLSAEENCVVLVGLYGDRHEHADQLHQVCDLVGLSPQQWRQPLKLLPGPLKQRLKLALSLVFDFDLHLIDPAAVRPLIQAGNWTDQWQQALAARLQRRGLVAVGGGPLHLETHCRRGLVLREGAIATSGSIDHCLAFNANPSLA